MGSDDWPDSDAWEIGFNQEPEDECLGECNWCGGSLVMSEDWGRPVCDSCGRDENGRHL